MTQNKTALQEAIDKAYGHCSDVCDMALILKATQAYADLPEKIANHENPCRGGHVDRYIAYNQCQNDILNLLKEGV